jgi:hypothetical protein
MQFIPQRTLEDPDGNAEFVESMRRLGATSPATACADRDLPRLTRERFRELLDHGILREAAPGTFYLYERAITATVAMPMPRAVSSRRLLVRVLFWLLVILVPVLFIQLSQRR